MLLNLVTLQIDLPFTARRSPQTTLLIMVSAQAEALVQELRQQREIHNAQVAGELYKAAQYLYQTDPAQFATKQAYLHEFISYDPAPDDLYLLELDLFEEDARFAPNVNPLDRYDAFMDLIRTSSKVKVSARLRMEVCACLDLYVR